MTRLITISIPVFNEEDNIPALLERITVFAESQAEKYRFEFLFTDNASSDKTFAMLSQAAQRDPRIRVLRFSRNFGYQQSILTNYLHARGDAAVQLDADLQDPPEMIADFLEKWEEGYKVVYGVRADREGDLAYGALRKLFYRLLGGMTEYELPKDAGDFRLIDRDIIEHLRGCRDHAPYLRGLISSMGYAQTGIPYKRDARHGGASKFNFGKMLNLAIDGFCSQTTAPLQLIMWAGIFVMLGAIVAAGVLLGLHFFTNVGQRIPGYTSLAMIMLFATGLQAFFLGVIGEYIGRIYNNVRSTPGAIIDQRIEPLGQGSERSQPVPAPLAIRENS